MSKNEFLAKIKFLGWKQSELAYLYISPKRFKPRFLLGVKEKSANFLYLTVMDEKPEYSKLLEKNHNFEKTLKLIIKHTK